MIACGIDPGINGGITFINDATINTIISLPLPTINTGGKERVDPKALSEILRENKPDVVCVEKVGAMPGQGVTSMFSFGYGAGIIEGILAALSIPYSFVIPQTWMKTVLMGLPKNVDSKSSIIWCQRFFPSVDWRKSERSKKPHDGKTDSACIAWYALKQYGFSKNP